MEQKRRLQKGGGSARRRQVTPKLNARQERFCKEYIRCQDPLQAALKAGYNPRASMGARLMQKPDIRLRIGLLQGAEPQKTMGELITQMTRIAFADLTEFIEFGNETLPVVDKQGAVVMEEDGVTPKRCQKDFLHLKPSKEVDGTMLQQIYLSSNGPVVKLADRMKALEWLTKHVYDESGQFQRAIEQRKVALSERKLAMEQSRLEAQDMRVEVVLTPQLHRAITGETKGVRGDQDLSGV